MTEPALEFPWIHDRHSHVSIYAALQGCPDVSRLEKPEALALLRSLPKDRLSMVLGWYSARLNFSEEELSSLPPAMIVNTSLHGVLLTTGAREALKGSDPEFVERHRDADWCERNVAKLLSAYACSIRLDAPKLDAFMGKLQGLGIGSTEDMAVTGAQALDVIQSSPWRGRVRCWADPEGFLGFGSQARSRVAGLKLFADGALSLRTAAVREPYLGGGTGLLLHADQELMEKLGGLAGLGKPLAIHALGGRAVEQVLAVLERLGRGGADFPEVRLEHVQFIDEAQARRAKALGLVLSMQPNFSADSRDYADRLSAAARRANNPFRMLIDRAGFVPGEDLVFGSDGMPHGVETAFQWGLFPDHEGQRLTVEELVSGHGPALEGGGTCRLKVDETSRVVKLLESIPG